VFERGSKNSGQKEYFFIPTDYTKRVRDDGPESNLHQKNTWDGEAGGEDQKTKKRKERHAGPRFFRKRLNNSVYIEIELKKRRVHGRNRATRRTGVHPRATKKGKACVGRNPHWN